jgi:perosamine synthetase
MERLAQEGIETRPFFYPMHTLPMYRESGSCFPVADALAGSGFNVPSSSTLTEKEIAYICETLIQLVS